MEKSECTTPLSQAPTPTPALINAGTTGDITSPPVTSSLALPVPDGWRDSVIRALKFKPGAHHYPTRPWGVKWRASNWFLTLVVTLGVLADMLSYNIIVPVIPFRLQEFGHTRVAALTSFMLCGFSGGAFVAAFPVAYFFHKYPYRLGPLVISTLFMELSFVLFMLVDNYGCMVFARVIQGVCSTTVWTVGFALLCENVPEKVRGRCMGIAFSGVSVGMTIAPPIGGAMYKHLGWNAPFVLCIIFNGVDLALRLIVIEPRYVRQYLEADEGNGNGNADADVEAANVPILTCGSPASQTIAAGAAATPDIAPESRLCKSPSPRKAEAPATATFTVAEAEPKPKELSPLGVLVGMATLPRGAVALSLLFLMGLLLGLLETTVPLRLQHVWGKNADFVGIAFLVAAAPTFASGPIAGVVADLCGTERSIVPAMLLTPPWLPIMTLKGSVAGFIISFACCNFLTTLVNSTASMELANVSNFREGISEIHHFASYNVCFGVSSTLGTIIGGQLYDNVHNGWDVICWLGFSLFIVLAIPPLFYSGRHPLFWRWRGRGPQSGRHPDDHGDDLWRNSPGTGDTTAVATTVMSASPSAPVMEPLALPSPARADTPSSAPDQSPPATRPPAASPALSAEVPAPCAEAGTSQSDTAYLNV